MDENNNSSAIRLLVDALSTTLKSLSDKISSFQPILSQISQTTDNGGKEISEILHDIRNLEKTFNNLCIDFYNRTDTIIKNVEIFHTRIENVVNSVDGLTDELGGVFIEKTDDLNELFNKKTKELGDMLETETEKLHNNLNNSLDLKTKNLANDLEKLTKQSQQTTKDLVLKMNDIQKNIKPIGKFVTFVSKPYGFLVFIIGMIIASITITNCISGLTDYIEKTRQSYQQQIKTQN